jgi:hypothetical protein
MLRSLPWKKKLDKLVLKRNTSMPKQLLTTFQNWETTSEAFMLTMPLLRVLPQATQSLRSGVVAKLWDFKWLE